MLTIGDTPPMTGTLAILLRPGRPCPASRTLSKLGGKTIGWRDVPRFGTSRSRSTDVKPAPRGQHQEDNQPFCRPKEKTTYEFLRQKYSPSRRLSKRYQR